MKLALIADIHANLEALQVVLEDCKNQKVTHYACLGDVVGYNANPSLTEVAAYLAYMVAIIGYVVMRRPVKILEPKLSS